MNPFEGYQDHRPIEKYLAAYSINAVMRSYCRPRVLDIGCNQGRYCLALAPECSEIVGVEPIKEIIRPALTSAPLNCRFVVRPFECSMLRGERFDVILMLAVLSHLEPPALLARCVASALHRGGTVVFLTHTMGCDPATDINTSRFVLELRRFLSLNWEEIIECRELESQDKQGADGLQRRLLLFRNDQTIHFHGDTWEFHAAGGTSRVFRSGDRVVKLFEAEHDRIAIWEILDKIVDDEAAFLIASDGRKGFPRLIERGKRYIVMNYCGEQACRRNWPPDWESQVANIQQELVRMNYPLGEVALENLMVNEAGIVSLIDPVFIKGVHESEPGNPLTFADRVARLVATEMQTQGLS